MSKHVFPEVWPMALTQATAMLPRFIAAEVTLSFLGLGIDEPLASWGNMLGGVQQYHTLVSHSWLLLPVLGPILASLCCFLLADEVLASRAEVAA
jgi:peptide/nickel transport system permease protein